MSALARKVKQIVDRLNRDDYPQNGIVTHHGVSTRLRNIRIGVADSRVVGPHPKDRLLIMIYDTRTYAQGFMRASVDGFAGFPGWLHQARANAIAATLNTHTIDRWNGKDGHSGISMILDYPCPASLVRSIQNYRDMPSPFDLRPEDRAGFDAFDQWYAE